MTDLDCAKREILLAAWEKIRPLRGRLNGENRASQYEITTAIMDAAADATAKRFEFVRNGIDVDAGGFNAAACCIVWLLIEIDPLSSDDVIDDFDLRAWTACLILDFAKAFSFASAMSHAAYAAVIAVEDDVENMFEETARRAHIILADARDDPKA